MAQKLETMKRPSRRTFIRQAAAGVAAFSMMGWSPSQPSKKKDMFFKISLAQWSLHRAFQEEKLAAADFAAIARDQFGFGAVEYVNGFYPGKGKDQAFWQEMKRRADNYGVSNLLIMIDDEGDLGDTRKSRRRKAVENHYQWVDAAHALGCHSIRVNAFGEGTREAVAEALAESLGRLCTYAQAAGINVVIENHGLYSSDGQWVVGVIRQVNMPNCGTLPDFGNFCLARKWGSTQDGTCPDVYDRYRGVKEMLPYAKGVSAKSYRFDAAGNETTIDYRKMLQIVKDAGFTGYIGVEYEGDEMSEAEGIIATRALLEREGRALSE